MDKAAESKVVKTKRYVNKYPKNLFCLSFQKRNEFENIKNQLKSLSTNLF